MRRTTPDFVQSNSHNYLKPSLVEHAHHVAGLRLGSRPNLQVLGLNRERSWSYSHPTIYGKLLTNYNSAPLATFDE